MKETIIILGAGVMQGPAIKIAEELGFYTVALDGNANAPCVSMADRFEQIDLKDRISIETLARELQGNCSRLGIMTAGTDFSASVAWVCEKLNLPGIPYEAALNASDKSRMRACFRRNGLPSPDFFTITEDNTFDTIPLPLPLVIKPVDNMGGRGCRRINTAEEFPEASREAIKHSRSGRAIIECFMDGPEFSVDAIVYHGEITICGLADRHIFFPPFFIEMGHTMPTVIEEEKQKAILDTFCEGIRALGIAGKENISAAKGDIKLTAKGPMIGEIAARLSGGYMSGWTYPYSSGVLPIKAAILAAMGRKPEQLIPEKKWTCSERAFISIPGTVKTIKGSEQAKEIPYVNDLFLLVKEGGKVSFPENNVSKCGNIIASAPDRASAINACETASRSILIRLEPLNSDTSEFLKQTHKRKETSFFPPDAFVLTEKLSEDLAHLPEFDIPDAKPDSPCIFPFPAFTSSDIKDYMGRTIDETLEAARLLTGFSLPLAGKNAENNVILGKSFWAALVRGGYQGAVYYIDNLGAGSDSKQQKRQT